MAEVVDCVVQVKWVDTNTYSGWQEVPEPRPAYMDHITQKFKYEHAVTYGLCLLDDEEKIMIAGSTTTHDGFDIGDVTVIPKCCVTDIAVLVEKRKAKK